MEKIRAKMRVASVLKRYSPALYNQPEAGIVESIELSLYPVSANSEENKSWNKSTPSGELKLIVNNTNAFGFIESMPGNEFYVDIIPVKTKEA